MKQVWNYCINPRTGFTDLGPLEGNQQIVDRSKKLNYGAKKKCRHLFDRLLVDIQYSRLEDLDLGISL